MLNRKAIKMKEQLISFETAKLAKEKGFDWSTKKAYILDTQDGDEIKDDEWEQIMEDNPNVFQFIGYAPTQSLLQKWLREVHNIHVNVSYGLTFTFKINGDLKGNDYVDHSDIEEYWGRTYEEALEKGLQAALKLIK